MFAISLIGVTPEFEIVSFGKLPFQLADDWIIVSPGEVELAKGQSLYLVSRRQVDQYTLTWIGLYRYAKELGGNRTGGYYGAGIWLVDQVASGNHVVKLLALLAEQVNLLAMQNDQFLRPLSSIQEHIRFPKIEIDQVKQSRTNLTNGCGLNIDNFARAYLDFSEIGNALNMGWFVDWIQIGTNFTEYGRVLLSADSFVSASVKRLGRLTFVTPQALIQHMPSLVDTNFKQLENAIQKLTDTEKTLLELRSKNTELAENNKILNDKHENLLSRLGECEVKVISVNAELSQQKMANSELQNSLNKSRKFPSKPNKKVLLQNQSVGSLVSSLERIEGKLNSIEVVLHGTVVQQTKNENDANSNHDPISKTIFHLLILATLFLAFVFILPKKKNEQQLNSVENHVINKIIPPPPVCESEKNLVQGAIFTMEDPHPVIEVAEAILSTACPLQQTSCHDQNIDLIAKQFENNGSILHSSATDEIQSNSNTVIKLFKNCVIPKTQQLESIGGTLREQIAEHPPKVRTNPVHKMSTTTNNSVAPISAVSEVKPAITQQNSE
jgi:hypothetical protein